jgi:2-polyprenyl-3-methyl-5-hydroxy-6-metoxy-1,4-benzoquinol methylase
MPSELPDFSDSSLQDILDFFDKIPKKCSPVSFLITDPDLCQGRYAGEKIYHAGQSLICRSWRAWNDLATSLGYRLRTPDRYDESRVFLSLEPLEGDRSFHRSDSIEKYASESAFARIRKNEEPAYYFPYFRALQRLRLSHRTHILALGLNRGDELEAILRLNPQAKITGIDLAEDALQKAQERFNETLETHCHDLNGLETLDLGRFDLILSIGTLQSPSIEMKPLVMDLVQKHLAPDGALLLGWPNARWIDGELIYGARVKNYPFSELSLVIKDLFWIKKYLQQHKFRVVITGREYIFLEATKIGLNQKA